MRINDVDPDNMSKDDVLSTLEMWIEDQQFISSLITKETLSEQEQDVLWEMFKPYKKQIHEFSRDNFLFDEPLPESKRPFDAERCNKARLERLRGFIKKYKGDYCYFPHGEQEEELKKQEEKSKEQKEEYTAICKRYFEFITIKNADEALLVAQEWYCFWLEIGAYKPLASLLDDFIAPFIKDDDFLIKLLAIPEEDVEKKSPQYFFVKNMLRFPPHKNYCEFHWSDHWLSLFGHIVGLIRSYRDEEGYFVHDTRYLPEFYLYKQKPENPFESRKKLIEKLGIFLRRSPDSHKNKQQLSSDFLSPEKPFSFFNIFYKRFMEENEDSCLELFTFLGLYFWFRNDMEALLSNSPEKLENITERCSKLLGKFRNWRLSEQDYDCGKKAAWFLAIHHGLWRGLKPLLTAFRNSKRVLLANNLAPNDRLAFDIIGFFDHNYGRHNGSYSRLYLSITDDALKLLRQDMANDFVDYLKPLSPKEKERQAENYTEHERAEPGFDLHYKEPSAIWRYAYVRVLVDLGVKTDGQGHFLHEALKKTAENDPSEAVKKAAIKADRELNSWRDGINGNDHKRRLYRAFWWLRLAHLDSLDADIDRMASQRLRVQEWSVKS